MPEFLSDTYLALLQPERAQLQTGVESQSILFLTSFGRLTTLQSEDQIK